jgi:hypothetical protein
VRADHELEVADRPELRLVARRSIVDDGDGEPAFVTADEVPKLICEPRVRDDVDVVQRVDLAQL